MAAVLELGSVTDRGNDGCGGLGTDTLDLGNPLTRLAAVEAAIDLLVE
jgi:hypothetical protein